MARPPLRALAFALCSLVLLGGSALPAHAAPIDLKQRSVSSSRQFTVYSPDAALRSRVVGFAEELKGQWLQLMGENDRWKWPVIVVIDRAPEGQPEPKQPVTLSLLQYEAGLKVQIDVKVGSDPAQVNLQRHLLRALFLEYTYRNRTDLGSDNNKPVAEVPWWMVEGALGIFQARQDGGFGTGTTDLFKRIVEAGKVPPLDLFLISKQDDAASPALKEIDHSCALCLMQLLLEQPDGHRGVANYVRHLVDGSNDAMASLQRDFPGLSKEPGGAQKWWTLNLARISAANRFKGLTPEETDSELASLLQFEVPNNKGTEKKSFGIADFDEYLKLNASKEILQNSGSGVVMLGLRANALYRGVLADYEQIFGLLLKGKTHGVKERLDRVAKFREGLLHRNGEIADYLNWFEATQMDANKRAFEGYIKAANELSTPPRRNDPITRYLDEISQEL